jgi:hypothetical protein
MLVCLWWSQQLTGETVGEVRPVADMHQRKAEMARHSDCFIALPGPISLSLFSLQEILILYRHTLYPFCSLKNQWNFLSHLPWFQVGMELWKSCWRSSLGLNWVFMTSL